MSRVGRSVVVFQLLRSSSHKLLVMNYTLLTCAFMQQTWAEIFLKWLYIIDYLIHVVFQHYSFTNCSECVQINFDKNSSSFFSVNVTEIQNDSEFKSKLFKEVRSQDMLERSEVETRTSLYYRIQFYQIPPCSRSWNRSSLAASTRYFFVFVILVHTPASIFRTRQKNWKNRKFLFENTIYGVLASWVWVN